MTKTIITCDHCIKDITFNRKRLEVRVTTGLTGETLHFCWIECLGMYYYPEQVRPTLKNEKPQTLPKV